MSYCVNCGVELDNSILRCPLCDTPVINPNIINSEKSDPPFPERIELPKRVKNKYSIIILTIVLLIPNIVCALTNILLTPHLFWSVYVAASSLLAWFLFFFPFIMNQKYKYLILAVDALVTAGYIFVFYYYNSTHGDWFLKIAIPLDVGIFLIIACLVAFFSKKRSLTHTLIAVFSSLTVLNAYICLVIDLFSFSVIATYITMILGVSCLIFVLFFIAVEKNYKLRSWLSRKFFF